ncbi:MAG: hypothetical protein IJS99_08370 [Synergistaceae bacterium]|nr:hypothetical protein [Synergistaceae bacterium]
MRINHNLPALQAIDILAKNNDSLQKSMEALSSGLRVNLASDDASGLAISEKMRSQIAGYDVAIRNSQDGISMLRTAEGALSDADSFLQRMRELSIQASNETLTSQDRNFIQEEINNLRTQINIISQTTQFNKRKLLDGSTGILWSSDNLNLKAILTGDDSIENISPEKNYRIEINSNPGAAQIVKSNIIKGIYTGEFIDEIIYNDDGEEEEILRVIAENENTLRDIENFYNSDGNFIIEQPQLLNITQGDGKSAGVMIYGQDTLRDVTNKINDAIANKLGQAKYTNDAVHFATISDGTANTPESINTRENIYDSDGNITGYNINASIVIRSAISGKTGELHFTGDEDLMRALGLNTVQYARENTHNVSIYDAHTNENIIRDSKVTGNRIKGVISSNLDIEFAPNAGLESVWNETSKQYNFSSIGRYSGKIHVTDNSLYFQTGTNQDEKISVQFGDMSANSLGLDGVNVLTRESAMRSTGIIDAAIDKIVKERTKIVSYEQVLENTLSSLAISSTNLVDTNSRLTDADMAKSVLRYMEFQILSQSETAIIIQANQNPQSVLSLLDFGNSSDNE